MEINNRPSVRPRARLGAARRGSATIWGVVFTGVLLSVAALVVDGALLYASHEELQVAADSAALAGASGLVVSDQEVVDRAVQYAGQNRAGPDHVVLHEQDVEIGDWDPGNRVFIPYAQSGERAAVRVTARLEAGRGNALRTAFAQVFGEREVDMQAQAVAVYKPRDIMLVIDLSGSMSYDSQVRHINRLGREAVEANLRQCWEELGGHTYGTMGFETVYISSNDTTFIRNTLGLSSEPYPYPSGSWNDYINYVRNDAVLNNNGYRKEYGGLTFVNYLLEKRRGAHQTPDLWMTSHQPLHSVKDAVDVFMNLIEQEADEDRVGLAVYTAADGTALLEIPLTDDRDVIRTTTRRRQAGHYHGNTNIGDGIVAGREELIANGRFNAFRTMVLLTDGRANMPGNGADASAYALAQAQACAEYGIVIATISLGADAETNLMQSIADATGGIHFNIPGGETVDSYRTGLEEAFRQLALERPLQLVN